MSIFNFIPIPYDGGVLLTWDVTGGNLLSTSSDVCHVTIQYSINSVPNIVPNTGPYVVRDLEQNQYTSNRIWHPHLINGTSYIYTGWVVYQDTKSVSTPTVTIPVIPAAGIQSPFYSGSLSFSKLGTNTVLPGVKNSKTEIIVWLSDEQVDQRAHIEDALNAIRPAHTRISIIYEPYYIAHTTTNQFQSGSYASGSYTISGGYIKNKVATIDSSFSGTPAIFGGL